MAITAMAVLAPAAAAQADVEVTQGSVTVRECIIYHPGVFISVTPPTARILGRPGFSCPN